MSSPEWSICINPTPGPRKRGGRGGRENAGVEHGEELCGSPPSATELGNSLQLSPAQDQASSQSALIELEKHRAKWKKDVLGVSAGRAGTELG